MGDTPTAEVSEPETGDSLRRAGPDLAFTQLVIGLDYNTVFVALPIIGQQLGFGPDSFRWVVP